MRTYKRSDRVAALIYEIIAELVRTRLQDPAVQEAHLTRVELGDDLQLARIYFVLADRTRAAAVEAGFERARGFLRRELGLQLKMKFTPELRFHYDRAAEHVERVEEILNRLKDESCPE